MLSLYVHIPFCEKKCFYCSFVVSIGQEKRIDCYLKCLSHEAKRYSREIVETIYIGGGTPTLLSDDQLKRLFEIIRNHFPSSQNIECTIEANPEGLDLTKAKLLKRLGVNRISLGISEEEKLNKNRRQTGIAT